MPWGRVDDTWYDHPKLELLEGVSEWPDRLACAGLNSLAWSWCNRFLTDGKVPRATVGKLGGDARLVELLVGVGLWEVSPAGGYLIHDFLVYNESRADVLKRREKEAARKAKWRKDHPRDHTVDKSPDAPVTAGHRANGAAQSGAESQRPSRRESPRPRARAVPDPSRPSSKRTTTPPTPSQARGRRTNGSTRRTDYDAHAVRDVDEATTDGGPEWLG